MGRATVTMPSEERSAAQGELDGASRDIAELVQSVTGIDLDKEEDFTGSTTALTKATHLGRRSGSRFLVNRPWTNSESTPTGGADVSNAPPGGDFAWYSSEQAMPIREHGTGWALPGSTLVGSAMPAGQIGMEGASRPAQAAHAAPGLWMMQGQPGLAPAHHSGAPFGS